ncbi:hypothetical protein OG897_35515 [Streptomyces sp. NBC_00237]|uniref:hypothetical protein n=1 Tax=Streptomyces sp. NBC_00237 TaxID=2975687 RepID=UPI00225554DD|nr:hypothetical protein [Streptomyces sp. NBC_00237]MCX5206700.1 hypothetical protein [Streptomyces sp. NBC_00237]
MNLNDEDQQMAVRDFFTPPRLLEFINLRDMGDATFFHPATTAAVRLEGEPDAGCMARFTPGPDSFHYSIDAAGGRRYGNLTWPEVDRRIRERLTPVRYGALHQAVTAQESHDHAYVACPLPYRTPQLWGDLFYRQWSAHRATLALRASAALDAILPAAAHRPVLF